MALAAQMALAQDQRISFDIPAQSLSKALHAFSAATGIEVLVDARQAAGRQSLDVKGLMAPRDALETLLAGSNLIAQQFGPDTVTLSVPAAVEERRAASPSADQPYFVDIQRAVQRALCGDARTSPGQYRLALKLWIGQSGTVVRAKRLDTTGDEQLDVTLDGAMQGIKIGRTPPPDLQQPVALLILPRQTNDPAACSSGAPDLRRAARQ